MTHTSPFNLYKIKLVIRFISWYIIQLKLHQIIQNERAVVFAHTS